MWRNPVLISIAFALAMFQANATMAGGSLPAAILPELPFTASGKPAPGKFLVARRALGGTYFGETVIYLIEHDGEGTLGLVVNRSSDIRLSEALTDLEDPSAREHRLYLGGPVEPALIMMLVRSESAAKGMAQVADSIYLSADRSVLEAMLAAGKSADEMRLYIGYSGWSPGQLDAELERGSWHVVAGDARAIFSAESDSLWRRLIERLEPEGIEVRQGTWLASN